MSNGTDVHACDGCPWRERALAAEAEVARLRRELAEAIEDAADAVWSQIGRTRTASDQYEREISRLEDELDAETRARWEG